MAITQTYNPPVETARIASGSYLDDAGSPAAASISLGFTPKRVMVINTTDGISFDWFDGMAAGAAVQQVAAGTRTTISTGGITVSGRTLSFPVLQNKQYRYTAQG